MWDPGQVFYSTVSKFKGLERRCVVLGVDGFHDDQDPREVLYVGITRAIDILCIVAHRSTLAKYLPESAIEKLESNSYNPVLPESLDDEDDEELV
ncbi:MAG: ATP-binding domain-containing protein [Actinobacteria bacterium]|nr:ATP-binding domain-containing protein [Actinomycetota bacterium]